MRIALVAPLHETVPPQGYGGTERIVAFLAEGLVALGHSVVLFAAAGSSTTATLRECWPAAMRLIGPTYGEEEVPYTAQLRRVFADAGDFDVVHVHHGTFTFQQHMFTECRGTYVWTDHGLPHIADKQDVWAVLTRDANVRYIAISDSQMRCAPGASWLGMAHHGIPRSLLTPLNGRTPSYLALLGRIVPEKGILDAVKIAAATGLELRVAAKIDKEYETYFLETVAPVFRKHQVNFVGEIGDAEKSEFFSGALAMLFPILWDEPFGLVLIEAMACGCPVIAYNRGAVQEVIEVGVTGYIVKSIDEAVAKIPKAVALNRERIREVFNSRFTAAAMAAKYAELYKLALDTHKNVQKGEPLDRDEQQNGHRSARML